jgi:hypothetical protein
MNTTLRQKFVSDVSNLLLMKEHGISRSIKRIMSFFAIISPLTFPYHSDAGNIEMISKPSTGESHLAIAKGNNNGGDYYFVDKKTGKRLGAVLPASLRGARVNGIQTSWSPDGSKVAVLVSYGTKLSGVFLYSLRKDNTMGLVNLPNVDPIKVYDDRYHEKHFWQTAEGMPGYDENALGDWVANDTVKIIQGVAKEREDGTTMNFLVVLQVKIEGDRGQIVNQSLAGVLSNEQAEEFLKNWKH